MVRKTLLAVLTALALVLPARADDEKKKDKEPEPIGPPMAAVEEPAGSSAKPQAELVLVPGEASATPHKTGVAYANGGVIDVAQPNPTTIVVTMTGLAAVNADLLCTSTGGYHFDLRQLFEVCFHSKKVKGAKLTLEGRVTGLLRTDHKVYNHCWCKKKGGTADTEPAIASVTACDGPALVALTLPARSVCCGEDLSVYNREGPVCVPVGPGKYTLNQTWGFGTSHPCFHCRGASAEFAPQPYYAPIGGYWFAEFQPFNGSATKDFGFQVTIKLVTE